MLYSKVTQKIQQGTLSGQLKTIQSERRIIKESGIDYSVSVRLPHVSLEKPENLSGIQKDPFMPPYESDLYIEDWKSKYSPDFALVLNKFNVMNSHTLIITKHFESQFAPLTGICLQVMHEVISELDGFGFYNTGREAGPSQPHRHIQVLSRKDNFLPFYDIITQHSQSKPIGIPFSLDQFNFKHSICPIPEQSPSARELLSYYNSCLIHSLMKPVLLKGDTEDMEGEVSPHNLLMGINWLMVVPRTLADLSGIPGNGLNYIGSFFCKIRSDI